MNRSEVQPQRQQLAYQDETVLKTTVESVEVGWEAVDIPGHFTINDLRIHLGGPVFIDSAGIIAFENRPNNVYYGKIECFGLKTLTIKRLTQKK